jgi:hypothetical protein
VFGHSLRAQPTWSTIGGRTLKYAIEAGLYLTAGTVVTLADGGQTKARDLS